MKFAICEDMPQEAEWLKNTIQDWAKKNQVVVETMLFSDAASFLFSSEDEVFDALFLDIKMPGEDGMSLAKRLREQKNDVTIVFVTGEEEYISEGYEVEALNYLLKPVDAQKVVKCLNRIYERANRQEPYLIMKTDDTTVRILQKDIYKVEVYTHRLVYQTKSGQYETYASLKEARKELQKEYFVECYRGVLVNLLYVETIERDNLLLHDKKADYQERVPVSRRMYEQLNTAFIELYRRSI